MRRYLSIVLTLLIVVGVLVALSALSFIEFDPPAENESIPRRSSYNAGPTGARAFYQLLEDSGARVSRWRESYDQLSAHAAGASLIVIGPFMADSWLNPSETRALRRWVSSGGQLLLISRNPSEEFGDRMLRSASVAKDGDWEKSPENLVDPESNQLIQQPTALTRGTKDLALSRLATRLKIEPSPLTPTPTATPTPKATEIIEVLEDENKLAAPVIHLGDSKGAVLADFDYGDGRVIFLSDPFIVANNGIARGSNLTLALNLVNALSAEGRQVYFDEAHHGYRETRNPLFVYFRGTPFLWVLGQGLLIALLIAYTAGRRFARPLPLAPVDRHSPLEFVGSMANLQQLARARDLALENIYPRFRAQLARALGVSARAGINDFVAAVGRRRLPLDAAELMRTMRQCENVLAGEEISDDQLVTLVKRMREMMAALRNSRVHKRS
jgi:hypothetical protein